MCAAVPPESSAPLAWPDSFDFAVGAGLDAQEALEIYRAMLVQANSETNLVGASTLGAFWTRHYVDSAQLRLFAPDALVWADLGAGAGLPGLVLAILLRGRTGACVHLVESMSKRCRFLEAVARRLDLPVDIHNARAESLELKVEVVTARACAPLTRLLGFAHPYFVGGARGLFLKGAGVQAEIIEARRAWRFKSTLHPSLSDPGGRVLEIDAVSRDQRG